jgi:ribosomal protein S18 acetylase RimI-like enzyme
MSLLWLHRRSESAYGFFAMGALWFAVMVCRDFVQEPPLPPGEWLALYTTAKLAVDVFTCRFALRHAGWHWPRIEFALWGVLAVSGLVYLSQMLGVGIWLDLAWDNAWYPLVLMWTGIFIAAAVRLRRQDDLLLALAAPWCMIDDLLYFVIDGYEGLGDFTFLPLYAAMGWILLRRFARSLEESEQLNAELEQRVEQKQAELQANFQRLQVLEREQAVVEERSRIMSDMHDGTGLALGPLPGVVHHPSSGPSATPASAPSAQTLGHMLEHPAALAEYTPSWREALVPMWRESFEFGVGITDPNPIAAQVAYFEAEVLPKNSIRLALAAGQLVGFVAASSESVTQLHVRVGFHRRGIGSQMLNWAKSQSVGSLWLYTFARNTVAQAFYEHHGFRVVARGFESTWQLEDIKYHWSASRENAA